MQLVLCPVTELTVFIDEDECTRSQSINQSTVDRGNLSYLYEPHSVIGELNAFAKSVDSCQPVQSAQADMGRHFSLSINVLLVKGYILHQNSVACL